MLRKYCRYTPSQLRSLGLDPDYVPIERPDINTEENKKRHQELIFGQFRSVIDLLFDSKDGSLDYDALNHVTSSASPVVQQFASNVLAASIQSLQSAPDDETAFEAIIPRRLHSQGDIAPYLERLKQEVSDIRSRVISKQENNSQADGTSVV